MSRPAMLDERYLEWGLTALARSGATQGGWQGHGGACVLAAYYLAAEQDLPPPRLSRPTSSLRASWPMKAGWELTIRLGLPAWGSVGGAQA